jgi:zinc/manganese transport system substrate-binding protein
VSATANESDPSPGDLNAFLTALADGRMAVLVYNPQTEGPLPEQVREAAEAADVPVVEMTETLPPGAASFVTWQVEQLTALAAALDVTLP